MGWPSAGAPKDDNPNNFPCPGKAAQTMHRFTCEAAQRNVGYFYFSAFDSFWKTASHGILLLFTQIERYWGVFLSDRSNIKPYVADALSCSNSQFTGMTTDTACELTVGTAPGDGSGARGAGVIEGLAMSAGVALLALF
jgi:hypothetical protein